MAITRAQQAKQMLQNGGMLVQPGFGGKRQGYRGDAAYGDRDDDDKVKDTVAAGDGPAFGGPPSSQPPSYTPPSDNEIRRIFNLEDDRKIGETKQAYKQRTGKGVKGIISNFRNKSFQNAINRNKVLALRELGLMSPKTFNLYSALFQGFEEVPDYFKDLDEDELLGIATSGPYLSQQKTKGDVAEFSQGKNLLGRVFEAQDLLDQNKLTQDKFQELFPGPPKAKDEGSEQITDPCKGPNPPAYCFIGEKAEETIEAQRNLGGLPARITGSLFDFTGMADGGRIGAMGGGMMDLDSARQMMFLGGIAKSISKGLKGVTRAAKKVFKSPVGKAALLGLGAYYAPGIGIKATGGFSNLTQPGGFLSTLLTKGGDKALNLDNLSGLKIAGLLTAAPFLFSSDEEEEDKPTDMGPTLTMEELLAIRANPFKYLTPRIAGSQFAAEGGRIGFQEGGGIEARLEQLGGDVSSAEQMLQSINQRLKTAESSLGSGGGLGGLPGASGPLSGLPGAGGPKIDEAFFGNTSLAALSQRPVPESMQSKPQNLGPLQSVQQSKSFDNMSPAEKVKLAQGRLTQKDMKTPEMLEFFQNIIKTKGLTDMQMPAGPSLSSLTSSSGNLGIPASGYAKGGDVEPVAKKVMPLLDMGGKEMDLRDNGGFVPIGRMEKADDVPARLSKNEFVFTADAVRNAGDGDVDKGAEVMYNMMKNLERGGNVSEESQGLEGAREMFQTAQRLGEVV